MTGFKSVYTISVVYDYPNNCDSFIAVVVPATAEKNVHPVKSILYHTERYIISKCAQSDHLTLCPNNY